MTQRYKKSEELLERALRTIPLGSQTFSKSKTQFPVGVSPYFVERGEGSHIWDVDGNEYVDFVNGLASISLGYNDPDVNSAVKEQIENGVIFSLPHRLEMEVAEKMVEMVPCAEMVRFGKNGSDATTGAIRLSRAFTGRDHIAVCGYHGWQDWYIGSTSRDLGVPRATKELTHPFEFNNLSSLGSLFEQFPDQISAVILEPMNTAFPQKGFLEGVRDVAHAKGAVLVFDEIVNGFRLAKGGAQEYFGVVPDLTALGKALGNGYPISALAGRKEIMRLLEDVFFSFTFGGETLSLAAARAVLEKIESQPVIATLHRQGEKVLAGTRQLIQIHGMEDLLGLRGHPVWSFLVMRDVYPYTQWEIQTLFFQEVFDRGILTIGTHNMSFAHTDEDVERLLKVYDEVFPILKKAVEEKTLIENLRCNPVEPLFKVR